MADDRSRRFDLSDPHLLTYFNVTYPQNKWWQMRHLWPTINSALIYLLQCKRKLIPEIIKGADLAIICGKRGNHFAQRSGYLRSYATLTTPSLSSKSSPAGAGIDGSPIAVHWYGFSLWKNLYLKWGTCKSCWRPRTLVWILLVMSMIASPVNFISGVKRILGLPMWSRRHSAYSTTLILWTLTLERKNILLWRIYFGWMCTFYVAPENKPWQTKAPPPLVFKMQYFGSVVKGKTHRQSHCNKLRWRPSTLSPSLIRRIPFVVK